MRIAIFSLIEWDFVNQRPQAFARELARCGHDILYVEPPALVGDPEEWLEQRRAGKIGVYEAERGIQVAEGTMILFREGHRELYSWNTELASITARWLGGFNLDFAIVLSPEYTPALDQLGVPFAYDHVDDTQHMPGVDTGAFVRAMEHTRSGSAFNIYIQEPTAERDPRGFFLPNGVDVGVFFPVDRPKLFDGVVLSTIAKWFDMDSILGATSRLLLIGPMDHDLGDNRRRLFEAHRPNVHWIPQVDKPTANLWLSTAHVGIVPFKPGHPVIPYAMPVKILEYFMAGLPVVTYRSEGIERFYGDRVTYYSADGDADPCLDDAIERARQSGADNRSFALQYRWENLVALLDQRISEEIRRLPQPNRRPVAVTADVPDSQRPDCPPAATPVATEPAAPRAAVSPSGRPDDAQRRYIATLQRQLQERTAWAVNLDREARERTEWAQRLERERDEQAERAVRLQRELDERTTWALELSFIRQQWWFKVFSPGWRGWLRQIFRRDVASPGVTPAMATGKE